MKGGLDRKFTLEKASKKRESNVTCDVKNIE